MYIPVSHTNGRSIKNMIGVVMSRLVSMGHKEVAGGIPIPSTPLHFGIYPRPLPHAFAGLGETQLNHSVDGEEIWRGKLLGFLSFT